MSHLPFTSKKARLLLGAVCLLWGLLLFGSAAGDEMPLFFIETRDSAPIESKEEYIDCSVSVGAITDAPAQIRGRGNSSWGRSEKKSYRIKFDDKQNPLDTGISSERDWVLIANHFDKSLLRNFAAQRLASHLDGLEASVGYQSVQLYLNDEYMGVYLLCERIEENSLGLEISSHEGGFLLELDIYATGENSFIIGDKTYAILSDYLDEAQWEEIYYFIDDLDTAIMADDEETIRECMDIPSWVDAYIVEELMMNMDVGYSSFFMYRPDASSKLYAGPVWDFDYSAGNQYVANGGGFDGLYAGEIRMTVQDHQWFAWLMGQDWFAREVYERWAELGPILDEVLEELAQEAARYEADYAKNFERWPVLNTLLWLDTDAMLKLDSHKEHATYLIDWLRLRMEWLKATWSEAYQLLEAEEEAEW